MWFLDKKQNLFYLFVLLKSDRIIKPEETANRFSLLSDRWKKY